MYSYPATIIAFQRIFIRGPENCSEAEVWGSLESSDLDIIMFKRSQNNLRGKKQFVYNLKGNAGGPPDHMSSDDHCAITHAYLQCFAICQTYNFWLPREK